MTLDYFIVQLPHHGTRYIGECTGCGKPVIDNIAGSAFVCTDCLNTHCLWCGHRKADHQGAFDMRRIIVGSPDQYLMPPGECPDYKQAVCADCSLQIGSERVIICQSGVIHARNCFDTPSQMPFLSEASELMPKLRALDEDCSSLDEIEQAVMSLPKPWRSDATWRTDD